MKIAFIPENPNEFGHQSLDIESGSILENVEISILDLPNYFYINEKRIKGVVIFSVKIEKVGVVFEHTGKNSHEKIILFPLDFPKEGIKISLSGFKGYKSEGKIYGKLVVTEV